MDAQTFETIIRSKYPHKWMAKDISFILRDQLIFAMDTHGECQLPLADKHKLASHILNETNGFVIKDSDGLFSSSSTTANQVLIPPVHGNGGISSPNSWSFIMDWDLVGDDPVTPKSSKCECGAHSVGSNRHSGWCQVKGDV
jgi:hypothetical protein